ncbi:MAG: penicillin acylase family protein [Stellaceae bacterium]
MRWIGRLALGIVIVAVLVVGAVLLWLVTTVPPANETLRLAGLTAPVTIEENPLGIPTITARNDRDAAFAVGYLHAQNRLFQMDLMRHDGAGRLSEWFGKAALPIDEFMRTLGVYRLAEAEYHALPPKSRALVDAYVAGVNAWIKHRSVALPAAYYLIGVRPKPWRPADTLVWGKLMALQLAGNFRGELFRARLFQHIPAADIPVLYPAYPKDAPTAWGKVASLLKGMPLGKIYAALPRFVGPIYDSNNWVVDGRHTVSGKPMLANDPHLGLDAPGVWYLVHIKTPHLDLAGVTAPGDPYVVIGHNAHIAWGFTNTGSDVEDLFIEKVDPKDPSRYLTPDGSLPFKIRKETIEVRGAAPVTIKVRATRHGPVISDLGGRYATTGGTGTVLALEATWLLPGDETPETLQLLDHARNWNDFRNAMKFYRAPEQNMVFADTAGNIGFIAPGLVPIRGKGDGWLPAPGWNGDYDWKGFIPFDQLPQGYDPAGGRFVTANQKIVPDSYPYFLTRDWDIPNRARRINTLLDAKAKLTPADFARIQADTLSLMAKHLVPLMTRITPQSPRDKRAIAVIKAWHFHMDRQEVAPLLFVAWLRELNRELFQKRLGAEFNAFWQPRPRVVAGILTKHQDWCRPRGGKQGDCALLLTQSLDRALDGLAARLGGTLDDWRWGRLHRAPFDNPFWSHVPGLNDLFRLDIPTDGGSDTVNRGEMHFNARHPYADIEGPGLRMIVDLAHPGKARFLVTPGQAGSPLSPHYADLALRWRDFRYLTLTPPRHFRRLRLIPDASPNRGN